MNEQTHQIIDEQAQQIINYIVKEIVRSPGVEIHEDTPLVSSGLIDSLELVNILAKLEDVTHIRIPGTKVKPKDMDTDNLMFAPAQSLGRPPK